MKVDSLEGHRTEKNWQRGLRKIREMVVEADEDIAAGRVGPFNAVENKRAVRKRLEEQPHGIDALRFADGSQNYLPWKLT